MNEDLKKLNERIIQSKEFMQDYISFLTKKNEGKKVSISCFGTYYVSFDLEEKNTYRSKTYSLPLIYNQELATFEEQGIIEKGSRIITDMKAAFHIEQRMIFTFAMKRLSDGSYEISFQNEKYSVTFHANQLSFRQINQVIQSTSANDTRLFQLYLDLKLAECHQRLSIPTKRMKEHRIPEGKDLEEMSKQSQVHKLIHNAPKDLQTSTSLKMDASRFVAGSNNHACTFSMDIEGLKFWFATDKGWERKSYLRNGLFSYILTETCEDGKYYVRIKAASDNVEKVSLQARYELLNDGKMSTILVGEGPTKRYSSVEIGRYDHAYEDAFPFQDARHHVVISALERFAPILLQEMDIMEKVYFAFLQEMGLAKPKNQSLQKTSN